MLKTVQFVSGNATLVVASTLKLAPDVFVKSNWKLPSPSRVNPVSTSGLLACATDVVKVKSPPFVVPALFTATIRKW